MKTCTSETFTVDQSEKTPTFREDLESYLKPYRMPIPTDDEINRVRKILTTKGQKDAGVVHVANFWINLLYMKAWNATTKDQELTHQENLHGLSKTEKGQ